MTNTTMSARFAESDFRIGPVLTRSATVLSQHFLIFFGIGVIANVPSVLIGQGSESVAANPSGQGAVLLIVGGVLAFVLSMDGLIKDHRSIRPAQPLDERDRKCGIALAREPVVGDHVRIREHQDPAIALDKLTHQHVLCAARCRPRRTCAAP